MINLDRRGPLLLQTVWAVTPDLVAGRRRTEVEPIVDQAQLVRRLAELAPLIWSASAPPAAAAHVEGSAAQVADPGPAHPAAGDDLAAAA